MITFIRQLFVPITKVDLLIQLRTSFIRALAIGGMIVSAIGLIAQLSQQSGGGAYFSTGSVLVASALLLILLRFRLIALASLLIVAMFTIATLITPMPVLMLMGTLALISSASLVNRTVFIGVNCIIFARLIILVISVVQDVTGPISAFSAPELTVIFLWLSVGTTTRYFIERTLSAVNTSGRNTILLQASAEIGQELSSLLDARQLFTRTVDLVRDRLGYYHVQIFMVDEDTDQANLIASTGEVGQRLMAQKHRLAVGSASVIGRATRFGEPVVARINQRDSIHKPNPLLPNTKAELAIPIAEGEKIIGALDVQSLLPNAFQSEDVQALQTVANLLASAIRNARLFEQQSKSVQEQQRLFLDSEANLREIQRLNQQLTKAGWADYTRQPDAQRGVTLRESRVVTETGWTDMLIQASQTHRPVVREANGAPAVVAVPVILRGEVIGAIEVEPSAEADQTTTVEMVEAVAQRLAISLDNARLFEEAQAATSIDDLLRITLTELSQSLGAQQGAIRLGVVQGDTDHD